MTLWLLTGINIGLAFANVMIAFFNLRIFRAHQSQIAFYKESTSAVCTGAPLERNCEVR